MLKAITHFEQVPLGLVMEIVERDEQRERSEEPLATIEQNAPRAPASLTAGNGAARD